MKTKNTPWGKQRSAVECCRNCVPPKRYPGCGADCKEYKEQKAKYIADKEREREYKENHPALSIYDFNKY